MVASTRIVRRAVLACGVGILALLWGPFFSGSAGASQSSGGSTPNRTSDVARYVGASTCAQCHADIAAAHKQSGMGQALELPESCRILRANPQLSFRSGAFTFRIARQGTQSIYTVSNGTNTISEPVLFAFGQGNAGQTYLYKHEGAFYE